MKAHIRGSLLLTWETKTDFQALDFGLVQRQILLFFSFKKRKANTQTFESYAYMLLLLPNSYLG